ncbi:hypothetical protein GCM10011390_15970 [Aureimonas endophytica]|uniref:DUF4160 domain-containing protein n=1 Tax=Aureimonas endophytica TaxID=2027858 RepID=A0A916ZHU5_9HYPH|nr:DUF4160 domain-containing protein [Aureimonas endophytica]GGD97991.1 hypothetical protein GCM10011390_15970 [Aureimonas endophytica]
MPTVLRWKGNRFFWYVADGREPPHVHIFRDDKECKIWLHGLSIAFNKGYTGSEMRALLAKTAEERASLLEIWHEQFGH